MDICLMSHITYHVLHSDCFCCVGTVHTTPWQPKVIQLADASDLKAEIAVGSWYKVDKPVTKEPTTTSKQQPKGSIGLWWTWLVVVK